MSRPNFIALIKEALPAEIALRFEGIVDALGLGPDDPELVLCAALASFFVSLGEFRTWVVEQFTTIQALFARFLGDVDFRISEAFTKCVDEMQTEIRTLGREVATSEFSAGAVLRSAAINAEVQALRNAIVDFEKAQAALDAAQIAGRRGTGDHERNARPFAVSPPLFAALAAMLVIGVLVGSYLTKRTYAEWRPPVHGATLRVSSLDAVRSSPSALRAAAPAADNRGSVPGGDRAR